MPPLGQLGVTKVWSVYSGAPLEYDCGADGSIAIHNIDRTTSPADSIIAVQFQDDIDKIWE